MGVPEDFEAAVLKADALKNVPQDDMLVLYGLFKQAKFGDESSARPGILDQKGRYKWDAYDKCRGMSNEAAMLKYIETVEKLSA